MPHHSHRDFILLRRILRQSQPYWPHLVGLSLLGLLASPLALLTPLPLKIAVDSAVNASPLPPILNVLVPSAAAQSVTVIMILVVGLVVAIALLIQLQLLATSMLGAYTAEKLVLEFRARLFNHVQRLSVSYHDVEGSADSMYRIQTDAMALQYITIDGFIPFISATCTLVGMIYVTARIDWKLAFIAGATSPLLIVLSRRYRPLLRDQSRHVKTIESSALSVVHEVLSALRVVQAFGMEEYEQNRYIRHSSAGVRARLHLALAEGCYGLLIGLVTALGTGSVLWLGVRHVRSGVLSLGNLLLIMSYLAQLYAPLKIIGRKSASVQGHLASIERAFGLLDELPEVIECPNARSLARAVGTISFQGVSFAYRNDRPVLHDISFEVPAGSCVGITGRTGAGKTTLVSLLSRFYDPTGGRVLLDGIDLRDYKLDDLRNQFAIVLQEPVLFSTGITENIAYAKPGAPSAEIVEAAKAANAHDFIRTLPDGYNTPVGERGVRLSGGERQRISLARAFLKNAPVLILDEPTSSLDSKTEASIIEALIRLMHGRTTFMIAHRFSTLEQCNLRVELENGRLVSVERVVRNRQNEKIAAWKDAAN